MLEAFETWLLDEGAYSRNSARKARRDIATQQEHGPIPPNATRLDKRLIDYRWAWALFDEFCEARRKPKRLEEHISIPPKKWRRFLRLVELDPSPPARVIDVMCSTGKRIGDVLRLSTATLDRGFRREDGVTTMRVKGEKPVVICVLGGAETEWRRLRAVLVPGQLVCTAVSKRCTDWTTSGAAYQRCRRKLKELAQAVGIKDRVHLHRLRRTVAVQAIAAGVTLPIIQKMLDHEDIKTTQLYTDEAMARQVSDAIAQTRRRDDD
jgi:integrase